MPLQCPEYLIGHAVKRCYHLVAVVAMNAVDIVAFIELWLLEKCDPARVSAQ